MWFALPMKIKTIFEKLTNKQRLFAIVGILASVVIGSAAYYRFALGWGWMQWVGLEGYVDPTGQYHPTKALWDWMELLIVPLALAIGAWWLNKADKETEERIASQKSESERALEADRQRQSTLETYFDRMTELLLTNGLRASEDTAEVRSIARSRTLTVLRTLDPARKGQVLRFLYESNLINKEHLVINLQGVDLSGTILTANNWNGWDSTGWGARLSGANLDRVDLSGANLSGADLSNVELNHAELRGTILTEANLSGASLFMSDFSKADLSGVELKGAYVKKALFHETNLRNALMDDPLPYAYFAGAIMPDGNLYEDQDKNQ
jgi:uncharacterized protein YjbI with pentapeptide repeats